MALLLVMLSYLLGSFPSAYLAGRRARGIDIRKVGDQNAGAANVYRHIGHRAAAFVVVADIAKGAIPILVARLLVSQPYVLLCGLAALAGHIWPVFIGFKGGRGEATILGVLLALLPKEMAIVLALSALPYFLSRNLVLVGIAIFAPLPVLTWLMEASWVLVGYSLLLPCLVGLAHAVTTRKLSAEAKQESLFMR
jgi:glycerol-3-phosphate acyltransferase PlsY